MPYPKSLRNVSLAPTLVAPLLPPSLFPLFPRSLAPRSSLVVPSFPRSLSFCQAPPLQNTPPSTSFQTPNSFCQQCRLFLAKAQNHFMARVRVLLSAHPPDSQAH